MIITVIMIITGPTLGSEAFLQMWCSSNPDSNVVLDEIENWNWCNRPHGSVASNQSLFKSRFNPDQLLTSSQFRSVDPFFPIAIWSARPTNPTQSDVTDHLSHCGFQSVKWESTSWVPRMVWAEPHARWLKGLDSVNLPQYHTNQLTSTTFVKSKVLRAQECWTCQTPFLSSLSGWGIYVLVESQWLKSTSTYC